MDVHAMTLYLAGAITQVFNSFSAHGDVGKLKYVVFYCRMCVCPDARLLQLSGNASICL